MTNIYDEMNNYREACCEANAKVKKLQDENAELKELLRETLEVFNAQATHHGGTMRIFDIKYLREFAVKIEQTLKGGE